MFWSRSIRRRPAAATVLALLALVATVVSVLAPLLLRAVEQANLDATIRDAGLGGTSIAASAEIPDHQLNEAEGAVVATTASASDARRWLPGVVVAESSASASYVVPDQRPQQTRSVQLAGLATDCRKAGLSDGHCPSGADEVLAAAGSDVATGTRLRVTVQSVPEQVLTLRVVGTYDPDSRVGRIAAGAGKLFGSGGDGDPDLVMSLGGFEELALEGNVWSVTTLAPGLRLDEVPAVVEDVRATNDATLTTTGADSAVSVQQRIDVLVDRVADGNDAATVIVAVAALQAIVLAWFAQGVAAGRIGQARAAEWGLTRLRGLPARRRLVTVLAEPVIATVVGAAVGSVVGFALAAACVPLLLGADAPAVEPFRAPVLAALAASLLGSLVALVVASARAARVPLVDLLRRVTEPRTLSRTGAVVQAVAVIAAVVGIAAVVTQPRISGPGVALLAPTLVAVLLAVVALRVGVAVVRRRAVQPAGSLTELLVVRRIARTPSVLTTAVVVVMGVALAVSSSQTAVLAVRLADDRAAAVLGAAAVLDVEVGAGRSFVGSVRDADPDGRSAMAVETTTSGSGVGRLVALDSTRLAAVSAWDPAWGGRDVAALERSLRPSGHSPLRITGERLSITLADVGAPDGTAAQTLQTADQDDVDLVAVVQAADGWHHVDLGGVRAGTLTSAAGAVPCSAGCRLVWLGLETHDSESTPYGLGATVTAIDVDGRAVSSSWLDPDRWRDRIGENSLPSGGPSATIGAHADGLGVSWLDPTGQGSPSIAPWDSPEPLPAVVGKGTALQPFAGVRDGALGIGLNGESLVLRVVGRAPALPRVLGDGALVDLSTAGRVTDPRGGGSTHEVWVAPGATARVTAALRTHGITVTGHRTLADAERRAERAAPVLGALVGLPVAGAALALTLVVVAGVGVIGARTRREDARVLRTAGFGRRALRRSLLLETFLPAAAATVVGAIAGTAATLLTAARLPLRAQALPPMGVPVGPVTVLVVTVSVLVVAFAVSVLVARSGARPTRDGGAR
ncbi:FtsX-like permease family protein [Curtobacterium sp. NPDC090217]|uniref:FtsX-like permease family protein n=1 Tax=Curtobacterium sp. NPDC090217 TaxID=3363970 RepID=UPI0038268309